MFMSGYSKHDHNGHNKAFIRKLVKIMKIRVNENVDYNEKNGNNLAGHTLVYMITAKLEQNQQKY